jgi:single-strand DNA-binding protein
MSSYNKVIMVGRLTKDPEVKQTPAGKTVAKFSLAVDRRGSGDKKEADFFFCTAWEKTAELIGKFLAKGSQCLIDGRVQNRSYEKDGQKHTVTEIIVDNVQFLGAKKEAAAPADESETPF